MVGDVDVVQLDHHGSTTANNQVFLGALKAEVAFAQTGENQHVRPPEPRDRQQIPQHADTGGPQLHRHRRSAAAGAVRCFYQNEASPAGDDRVTQQGYTGAAAGNAGQGTILLSTDGTTTYSLSSFDDGGVRIEPGRAQLRRRRRIGRTSTADFPPTVVAQTDAAAAAGERERDGHRGGQRPRVADRRASRSNYSVNGTPQPPIAMTLSGGVVRGDDSRTGRRRARRLRGHGHRRQPDDHVQPRAISPASRQSPRCARSTRKVNRSSTDTPRAIQGTVTASGFSAGTNDDYVQDATGAINVYRSTDTPTAVHVDRSRADGGSLRPDRVQRRPRCGSTSRNRSRKRRRHTASSCWRPTRSQRQQPSPSRRWPRNPEAFEGSSCRFANCTIVSGAIPATPQPLDAFVTITDGTGTLLAEDRSRHRCRRLHAGVAVHRRRHRAAGRFPASVRFGLQHHPAQPRRPGRRGAGAGPAADDWRGARIDEVNNADGTPGADFIPDRVESGRQDPRHGHLDRFPRRQRHRVLRPGRHRRHRSVQHRHELRSVRNRRHARGDRHGDAVQRPAPN